MGTVPSNTDLQAFFFTDFTNSYIPNILDEIYLKKVYQPFLQGKKDLTIVEIGANIGLASYYFKDFAKTVYAIEPSKRHIECLEKMINFNKIDNIKVYPYAISNKEGKEKFFHFINTTGYSLKNITKILGTGSSDDFEEVETKTLETFMKDNNIDQIDFLKLDCEGAESDIISSEGFKNIADKIKVIVFEHHQWTEMNKQLFANTLKDLGFEVKWLYNIEASIGSATRI